MFHRFLKLEYISSYYVMKSFCHATNTGLSASRNVVTSKQIRELFLDFFKSHEHVIVPSSSVFLSNDPSLMFVNAGMNQFKPIFLEHAISPGSCLASLKRAANSQKCIRTLDLKDVGKDLYHHTLFEMLGNWSFGDYFKREACSMAWKLLTEVYKLPKERLYVTYFGGDESLGLPADVECRDIWLSIGVREDRILPFGMDSNFWEMGVSGPCGPCTEIHYDHLGLSVLEGRKRVNSGTCDIVELWNVVFLQYNRLDSKTLECLPRHHVDTGMGLERLVSVLQNKNSNYDTDLFLPLLDAIHKKSSTRPYAGLVGNKDIGGYDCIYRTIADHARMITVVISDGVFPAKRGAGHLLRRMMRKVFLDGQMVLGSQPGLLSDLADVVTASLGDNYPELWDNLPKVKNIIAEEEEAYFLQLDEASKYLAKLASKFTDGILKGSDAFHLFQERGLSEERIKEMADRLDLKVDWEGFKNCWEQEKARNVHVSTFKSESNASVLLQQSAIVVTEDSFKYQRCYKNDVYVFPELEAKIVALLYDSKMVDEVNTSTNCAVVLDRTNFYAKAGGQSGDRGFMIADGVLFQVEDTKYSGKYVLHYGSVMSGTLRKGNSVTLKIEEHHRQNCTRNHTASHLLQSALLQLLPDTKQMSQNVSPEKLRFSFVANKSFNPEELQKIEDLINMSIKKKIPVATECLSFESAVQYPDLITLENEHYPESVRMVTVQENGFKPISRELCCGTHVENTSDITAFVLTSHRSLGHWTKTLTAITGDTAVQRLEKFQTLVEITEKLSKTVSVLTKQDILDYKELMGLVIEISKIRDVFKEMTMPLLKKRQLEDVLQFLDNQCNAAINKYNKAQLPAKVRAECNLAIEEQSDQRFILLKFKDLAEAGNIFKNLDGMVFEIPTMAFVCNTDNASVKCWVPQHCVSEEFNAKTWVTLVANNMGGEILALKNGNADILCRMLRPICVSKGVLEETLFIAKQFVEKYMKH